MEGLQEAIIDWIESAVGPSKERHLAEPTLTKHSRENEKEGLKKGGRKTSTITINTIKR